MVCGHNSLEDYFYPKYCVIDYAADVILLIVVN